MVAMPDQATDAPHLIIDELRKHIGRIRRELEHQVPTAAYNKLVNAEWFIQDALIIYNIEKLKERK